MGCQAERIVGLQGLLADAALQCELVDDLGLNTQDGQRCSQYQSAQKMLFAA